MASEAYREKASQKKEKQAEEVWNKIAQVPELTPLLQLHEKIKELEAKRSKNREFIEETNVNFQALKKSIKDFTRVQNVDKKKR
jgi:hypothetical protein